MARLYEYQAKEILKKKGIKVPESKVCSSPQEVRRAVEEMGKPVVLKIQLWKTGRKGMGGIRFASTPEEAESISKELFGMKVDEFTVEKLLVEEKLDVEKEMFAGIIIDDTEKKPLLIFSSMGGTGVEEIAIKYPDSVIKVHIDVEEGLPSYKAREICRRAGIKGKLVVKLGDYLSKLFSTMRDYDARSCETNPIIITKEGEVYAGDAHIVIDDYAVYRHKELGIEIAREFSRPATELEKIAFKVEENDYRGTFYFFQMKVDVPPDGKHIGFHGAGGGGSMMSMDAVVNQGFEIANFTDTSGNPPSSKVYRAAMIILSQPNIVGYFASGSGVASQEQYNSARGFVKAFLEDEIDIPAVLRLGGNYEEKAIEILHTYLKGLPVKVEGYGKDDSPQFCAERMGKLIEENGRKLHRVKPLKEFKPSGREYVIDTITGKIYIDHETCKKCETKVCIDECDFGILKKENGVPVKAMEDEEIKKGKCTECLACEIACRFHGLGALYIHLPIPGLKEYRERLSKEG